MPNRIEARSAKAALYECHRETTATAPVLDSTYVPPGTGFEGKRPVYAN